MSLARFFNDWPRMTNKSAPETRATALITGASSGIGLELARECAARGHNLILVARSRDQLEAIAGSLEGKHGITVTVLPFDLALPESPQLLFDAVSNEGLHVDYLINNAGFGLHGGFSETDLDRELDMIQVNVTAVTHLTKLFLPAMLKRKHGRILNVASTAAFQPGPLMSIYYATKAYVLSFSQAIAEELRDSGVTVTAFCPGPTETRFGEVAGASSSRLLARAAVAKADDIARQGYAAMMKGERVTIPGLRDRVMIFGERLVPRAVVTRLARIAQEDR